MTRSDECCGWLGWAEQAGIGADGSRLRVTQEDALPPSMKHDLSFVTALLRRMLHQRALPGA